MKKALVTAAAAAIALCAAVPSFAQTVGVGVTVAPEELRGQGEGCSSDAQGARQGRREAPG
jgi:hypothetical protein